jgi:tetratricopeptide (TPR) repeat protein
MTRWLALLLVGFVIAIAPRPAHAEDPAMRAAKRHFERGEKLFALGKFDEALDEYQKAYDAKPIPDFLFNIGQCYRNLDDYDKAIFSFKKFIKEEPDAPNREAVQKLIDDLEDKKEHDGGRKIIDNNPPPIRPKSERPFYKQWWFWTGVGVVTVAGSVGIYEGTKGGPPSTDLGNIVFTK